MAVKWVGKLECRWCGKPARVGIEKDGQGNTTELSVTPCGIME